MPHIFYVIDSFAVGGAQTQLLQLLQGLDKRENTIAVCPIWPLADLEPAFRATGVEIVPIHKRFPLDFSEAFRLGVAIRKFSPHIVHTWLFTGSLWGRLGAWLAGSPVVIASERTFVTENYHPPFVDMISKTFTRFTDAVTVNSTFGAAFLVKKGYPIQKIHKIFNGVDTSRFHPPDSAECRTAIRRELGCYGASIAVGMVGRLVPQKNQKILIAAMSRLIASGLDIHLILIGDGPDRQQLVETVRDMKLEDRVHLTGQRTDIPEVLSALDIFALSSRWEGMPNVVLEAMATGLPVVATDVAGISDLVCEGQSGYIVPVDDPEKMAQALKMVAESSERRRSFGRYARTRCEQEFSLKKMVDSTLNLYSGLLKSKGLNGW